MQGRNGKREAAVATLRDMASDAEQRRWLALSLEARLAEWELLQEGGDIAATANLRRAIETQAKQHGFAWVLLRLR